MTKIQNEQVILSQTQIDQSFRLSRLQKKYDWFAYLQAGIANICIVFLQINLKIVSSYISPLHALAIRGFFLLLINTIVIHFHKITLNVKEKQIFIILVKRIFLSSITVSFFLGSIKYIPIGTANALFNVGPIMVCFVEAWRYKKPLNKIHLILTIVCFIGIILVIKPDFIFGNDSQQQQVEKIFMFLCLFAAITNAFSMLYLHDLKGKVNSTIALHYFYIGQCLFNSLAMTFQQVNFQQIQLNLKFFLAIFGLVFFAYATQNLTTRAMMLKKPSYIMPFGYLTIIVSTLTDKLIFGTDFSFLAIIGMFLTSSGLLVKLLVPEQKISITKELQNKS